ncbi:MAG: hypothetical protein ACI8UO_006356 [Verrucomicrobiales bacterium]|jgi:hypothetical protein
MKRLIMIRLNKRSGFVPQSVRQILALLPIRNRSIIVGIKPWFWLSVGAAAYIAIESIVLRMPVSIDDSIFRSD